MDLSIIIISYNTKNITKECLTRLKNSNDKLKKEIIVVDNASKDGPTEMIKKEFPKVILIKNKKNIGFARANIQAAKIAKGKYILLLNSDAFIKEDALEKTINFMKQNPEYGILGVRLIGEDSKLQHSARNFPTPWRFFVMKMGWSDKFPYLKGIDDPKFDYKSIRECDWVPGCYFLIRKKVIDDVGFFDKDYFLYLEEVDFCLRAKRKGWKVIFYPETEVIHLGGESAKTVGKITESGKQIEKFKLQSEYIYFRKNYNLFYVSLDLFFIFLFDTIEILKKIILGKKKINLSDKLRHIKLSYNILTATKFGKYQKINKCKNMN